MTQFETVPLDRSEPRQRPMGMAFWFVIALFAFEYLRLQTLLPAIEPLHIPLVLATVLTVVWLAKGNKEVVRDPLIRLYIVFIALTATGLAFSPNTFLVFKNVKLLALYLFSVALPFVAIMNSEKRLERFFVYFVWIHVGLTVFAFTRHGTGSGSFLEDENDLALALDIVIPYAWYLASSPTRTKSGRLLYYAVFVALVVANTATLSRGGFVGLVAVIGMIVYQSEKRVRNFIVLALLSGSAFFLFVPASYVAEMETISNEQDSTRQDRFFLWRRAIEMYEDNPVLGVGSGNFPMLVHDYEIKSAEFDPETMRPRWGRVAHSLYFTVLAEYGAAGVLVCAAMVILLWRRLVRITRQNKTGGPGSDHGVDVSRLATAMRQSMVGFLVAGAFLTVLTYPHFWYFIGFALALNQVVGSRKRVQECEPSDGAHANRERD